MFGLFESPPFVDPTLGEPYAELATDDSDFSTVAIATADGVWKHTRLQYVHVGPFDGDLAVELGYEVAWDQEHTVGARLRDGELLELSGSVVEP